MRILLDESLPRRLIRELSGHAVSTVTDNGWSGLENGELLRTAANRLGIIYDSERARARGGYSCVSVGGGVVSRMRAIFCGVSGIRGGIGFGGRPTGRFLVISTTGRLRFFMLGPADCTTTPDRVRDSSLAGEVVVA